MKRKPHISRKSHTSHWCGFLVAWDRMWTIRLLDWVNAFVQILHLYGFSPLCIRICVFNDPMWVKLFWQMLHWYGLFCVCDRTCLAKSPANINELSHCVHWNKQDSGGGASSFDFGNSRRRPRPGPCAVDRNVIH